jgi:hypothetical protein
MYRHASARPLPQLQRAVHGRVVLQVHQLVQHSLHAQQRPAAPSTHPSLLQHRVPGCGTRCGCTISVSPPQPLLRPHDCTPRDRNASVLDATGYWIGVYNPISNTASTTEYLGSNQYMDGRLVPRYASEDPYAHW